VLLVLLPLYSFIVVAVATLTIPKRDLEVLPILVLLQIFQPRCEPVVVPNFRLFASKTS
jgi:hypothetical protein